MTKLLKTIFPALLCLWLCTAGNFAYGQKQQFMDNRTALVSYVTFDADIPTMLEIEAKFASLKENKIDVVNWPDRNGSYSPEASFKMMYSDTDLYIRYQVEEREVRAIYDVDSLAKPWTDDCMELFIIPDMTTGVYFNIEMNCVGAGIVGYGPFRKDRGHFDNDRMKRIRRYSTLGRDAFGDTLFSEPKQWSMIIAIPLDLICQGKGVEILRGKTVKGNIFKCGDQMQNPHYLTWNPVLTPKPDYHRPEFFGNLKFE